MALLHFNWRRSVPSLLQTEKAECGLACLAMILHFHGHRVDLNTLRARYPVSQRGLSLKDLMALAETLHLCGRPLRLEPEDLPRLQLPAILHWDMRHFVVLARAGSRGFTVHDPATGLRKLSSQELGKHFTGVALELSPTAAFAPKNETRRLAFAALWRQCGTLAGSFGQILVLSLLLQGFALSLPFYTQIVIDDVLVSLDLALLPVLALGFLLVTLLNTVADFTRSMVILHLGNSLGFQLAGKVHRHLLRLPLAYFSQRHVGDVVSRFGSIHRIRDFITSGIIEAVVDGLMVLGTFAMLLLYSVRLAAFVCGILLLNSLVKFAFYRPLRRENEELLAASARENTTFLENLRGMQGIKLCGRERERNAVWQNDFADMTNKGIRVQKLNIYVRIARGLIFGAENILIVLLAAQAVVAGTLSVGMMIAFLSYKEQLYKRFFGLIDKYFDYRLLDVHLERLADIVHTLPEPLDSPLAAVPSRVPANCVELSGVGFRYAEAGPWVFRNVDLKVAANEAVAIVGPTGCGKSTLLRLLLSLHPPTEGGITLDGTPVASLGLQAWRGAVAGVLQDDTLLSGTIGENICFFDPAPDRARMEEAAAQAAIASDIERMPMRYETLVGNMGAALSGGQVQRILLARSFYRRCRLLVLDEATSHLDLDTELRVNASIRQLNIARVIVAHRPQSFLLADRVCRLTPEGLAELDKDALLAQVQGRRIGQAVNG